MPSSLWFYKPSASLTLGQLLLGHRDDLHPQGSSRVLKLGEALGGQFSGAGFLGTLTASNVVKLVGSVDPAYLAGAKFYMSGADYATIFSGASGILLNADQRHLAGFPVVITNPATNWVTATVSGPVFGNLSHFMTMRRVKGVQVQVLRERWADYLQIAVNVTARVDFQPRGESTAVAFSK